MHRDSAAVVGSRGWPNRIRHHRSTNTEYVIIDITAQGGHGGCSEFSEVQRKKKEGTTRKAGMWVFLYFLLALEA